MRAVVHAAVVMATHSGSVAADTAVSLRNYTQYQLLSLQNSTKQVTFQRSVSPLCVEPTAGFA
jgi:hypothetical protein